MGHISFNFTLKDKEATYPNLEVWLDKFSKQSNLDIICETKIRESGFRNNCLSHPLLSEKIYFYNYNKELYIDRNDKDYAYLFYIILDIVLKETINLGGGILSFPTFPDDSPILINQNTSLEGIFEHFGIDINDIKWVQQPYEIAKNMTGFTP